MSWISQEELLRDYPTFLTGAGKTGAPVDAPACSPYLNRPLRRYEDVATDRKSAIRPYCDDERAPGPNRGEKPGES